MLPLLFAASLAVAQAPDTAHVVLVATTDVHGRATAWDYLADRESPSGLTRIATLIDSLRRRYPGQVVVMDAGDLLQGNGFAAYHAGAAGAGPNPIVEAMNLAGYDVATPGNHDFDWGVPELERALGDAAFPYVSANVFGLPGDTLLVSPFRVLRRGPVRVGVTGFTTPGVMLWDRDRLRGRIRVGRIEAAAAPTFAAMRRSADLVVALSHSGISGASSYDTTGIGREHAAGSFAGMPARPDVVIVGHSHREIRDSTIGGVLYVQPPPHAAAIAVIHVDMVRPRGGSWEVGRTRSELVRTEGVAASAVVERRLRPAHEAVRAWLDEPVGSALAPMPASRARAGPSPMLDWLLETQRRRAGARLSAGPIFDLRAGLPADTIRRRDLLRLYPYENTLRAVRLSGRQLREYLEWSARYFQVDAAGRVSLDPSVPGYDFDVVRGARYDIDLRQPVGSRIRDLSVGGRPVTESDSFTVAINSHRQSGAGGYAMVASAPVIYDRSERVRELLEAELGKGPVDPAAIAPSEWRVVPEVAALAVRKIYDIPAQLPPASPSDTVVLRVLGTAGLHGALEAAGALAHAMDSLAAACACPTLRLDAGGAAASRVELAVLNRMGLAASALAERDFDHGVDSLRARLDGSRYPWVAANVFDSATGRRPSWLVPYRIIDTAGFRIAVLGYVTPETKLSQPGDRTAGLRFGGGELGLHSGLEEIRRTKPSLTVLVAHAGGRCGELRCEGELVRLAEELAGSGVSLILGGDGAHAVETRIAGTPVVSAAGPRTLAIGDLVKTAGGGLELRTRIAAVQPGPVTRGPLAATLDTFALRRDSVARRPQAQLKRPLPRQGNQHALGGLLAEARRNLARADLGLVRNASIARDLPAGTVTLARLREVEPSGSDLVRLPLTGAQVRDLLEHVLAGPDGPAVHLAGARVRYDPRASAGRRVKEVTLAGGRKLEPRERYTLATDDSTAAGAGGFSLLAGRPVERVGLLDVEAVAIYLRRLPQPVEVEASAAFQSTRR
ncbi:MAG TPA: 5'-nucleotidase C-terminal domain-containing protein [Gemmatimonadales bacterium]|nr:5'-nucleotidase C-terminal domain-containing protein [Gemmatimonadales bacterium]